ncbi:MAG: hypothetical protein P8I55_02875 [Crocinitomix sp.]|nr:hypothetical protein [Crocinitomix sp.]
MYILGGIILVKYELSKVAINFTDMTLSFQQDINGFSYALTLVHKKSLYGYFVPAIIVALLFYFLFSGGSSLGSGVSFMEDWWLIGWLVSNLKSLFGFISFMILSFSYWCFCPLSMHLLLKKLERI